jgi:hypothetical protein
MNSFEKVYDDLLLEMPHLGDLDANGVSSNSNTFDMELEHLTNRKDLLKYFYKLFFRGIKSDRGGNKIYVRSEEEKKALLTYLLNNHLVILYIKKIGKFETKSQVKKWLIAFSKVRTIIESKQSNLYKISLCRHQDNSIVKSFKTSAVSKKQALNNIKHRIRTTYPEYLNGDLYFIRLDEVVEQTVTTTTYEPQQYWWNRD